VTVLAVPPVIPAIQHDLHLGNGAIGALTGLPTFFLAAAAVPGALLVGRLGARRALLVGMAAIAVASPLRGGGPSTAVLYAMTLAMGIGVAVSQLALPGLVSEWLPTRIGLASAVYANGLLVGETVPTAADPWLLPALGHSWEWSLAFWALPVLLQVALLLVLTRNGGDPPRRATLARLPNFRNRQMLLIGLTFGMLSATYWGANTFIPGLVLARGQPELKDASLASLNAVQIPASVLLIVASSRLIGNRWPLVVAGGIVAASAAGMLIVGGTWTVLWAAGMGFAVAFGLVMVLALPPLLAPPSGGHTFAAGIFTVGYLLAFAGPVVGGAAADITHSAGAPFVVLGGAGVLAVVLAAATPMRPLSDPAGPAPVPDLDRDPR
jgi:CP family cyanate transporter-like MFS transporter